MSQAMMAAQQKQADRYSHATTVSQTGGMT
jgi:hypothetical protein